MADQNPNGQPTTVNPNIAKSATPPAVAAPAVEHTERFVIKVANEKFRGNISGVSFKGGVGYTNDPHQQHICQQVGAAVEDRKPPTDEE